MKKVTQHFRIRGSRVHQLLTKSAVPRGLKGDLVVVDLLLLAVAVLLSGALIDAFHLESYAIGIFALLMAGIGTYVFRKLTIGESDQ